jgi:hypothetical protein
MRDRVPDQRLKDCPIHIRKLFDVKASLSERTGFVAKGDEDRWARKPKSLGRRVQYSSAWFGWPEHTQFNCVGLEATETPAVGTCSLLTSPSIKRFCYVQTELKAPSRGHRFTYRYGRSRT